MRLRLRQLGMAVGAGEAVKDPVKDVQAVRLGLGCTVMSCSREKRQK